MITLSLDDNVKICINIADLEQFMVGNFNALKVP